MKPTIYAVDFDGTLCENKYPEIGEANERLFEYLSIRKEFGDEIILWTMREGVKLDEAVAWCKEHGLIFDAINDNLPRMKGFYGNNPRKVYADYYIDDHNMANDFLVGMNDARGVLPYHSMEWYGKQF